MTTSSSAVMPPPGSKAGAAPPQHQQYASPSFSSNSYPSSENANRRAHSANSIRTGGTPRNTQSLRKANRAHRRPRLYQDDEDTISDPAPVRATGSRRGQTNITHLMSFAMPPRPANHAYQSSQHSRRAATWGIGSGYHATDKARYIHANYRFVVAPAGNYTMQLNDPDIHLDWESILQILASVTEDTSCPICLAVPVAPRMATCGHIFCLSCIIRYSHVTEESASQPEKKRRWKPCPICFDSVFLQELKPVRWTFNEQTGALLAGNDVVFRLLVRKSNSTLALPFDVAGSNVDDRDIPFHSSNEASDLAHIVKGDRSYMEEQYNNEIEALMIQEKEDELLFGEDTIWSRKAITSVRDLKDRLESTFEVSESPITGSHTKAGAATKADLGTTFYFYQALTNSYMTPLDIRILKATFGDFSDFPPTIMPKIEHVTKGHVVDEETRKRARYLSHLPVGREINFVECDWTDVIPASILDEFRADLEKRRKRNHDKELREEKARLRAEQTEDRKLYGDRQQIPYFLHNEDVARSGNDPEFVKSSTLTDESPPSDDLQARLDGKYSMMDGEVLPSASSSGPRTVWGTPLVPKVSTDVGFVLNKHPDVAEDDGWLQGWEQDALDEQALSERAIGLSLRDNLGGPSPSDPKNTKRKKTKKTKITLMSTNGKRAA